MSRRVYLRAGALALVLVGVVAGLTAYFSTQKVPPCLVTGIPKWRPPTDKRLHRFELVVPDRALCFFDIDHDHALVGYVKLPGIRGITNIAARDGGRLALRFEGGRGALVDLATGRVRNRVKPPRAPSEEVEVADVQNSTVYSTFPGRLGFRAFKPEAFKVRWFTFPGFTWNPRFGPNPPDHGLALAPDKPELWVLDAPNNAVHVFDISGTPRDVKDIRLTKPLIGEENPCASHHCGRIGSLQFSADGRFVYVGDAGDVIDASKREEIANLEALRESRLMLEVDWVNGRPEFPAAR